MQSIFRCRWLQGGDIVKKWIPHPSRYCDCLCLQITQCRKLFCRLPLISIAITDSLFFSLVSMVAPTVGLISLSGQLRNFNGPRFLTSPSHTYIIRSVVSCDSSRFYRPDADKRPTRKVSLDTLTDFDVLTRYSTGNGPPSPFTHGG